MDLNLKLERKWKKEKYTIGNLFINGVFFSNVLEDKTRGLRQDMTLEEIKKIKIHGQTAIPSGRYEIRVTLSARFRRQLPILLNVPGYAGVRIHPGNTDANTEGCLLPGKNDRVGQVSNSRATMAALQKQIEEAIYQNSKVYIEIVD